MAEQQIAIAKETSVQEVSDKIGATNAKAVSKGPTIFSRVRYLINLLSTLSTIFSSTRINKINALGTSSDSTSAATVFGKLKSINDAGINGFSESAFIDTAKAGTDNTITVLDEEISNSIATNLYLGTMKIDKTGIYTVTMRCKVEKQILGGAITNGDGCAAIRDVWTDSYQSEVFFDLNGKNYTNYSADIFLRAGGVYQFFMRPLHDTTHYSYTETAYVDLITVQYNDSKSYMYEETTVASGNSTTQLTLSSTTGTATSETQICTYTALKTGSLRLSITIPSANINYTKFYIQVNGHRVHYHNNSSEPVVFTVDVAKNDVVTVTACSSSSENAWKITRITVSYDIIALGKNPMFFNTVRELLI